MSNSKKMLSFLLAVIIIVLSVTSSTAVIAPENSISAQVQWMYKIDDVLLDKMSNAAETDLIPVWVWMTDIDMEQLDKDIETRTGVSQQKLDTARAEIGFDVSTVTAYDLSDIDSSASAYREATKAQREQIANDTEVYLAAKKSLASQRYTTANTAKIRQIGVSNNRIDFQSTLTPSFIAFLTKAEIIETAQSDNVVEMGYFSEYDAESTPAPTQARAMAEEEEQTHPPTLDVSTLHTGIKQVIQHDDALEKYGVTGNGIKVLHIDNDYIRSDKDNSHIIPNSHNIYNFKKQETYEITDIGNIPLLHLPDENGNNGSHANFCASYLQAFAKDVTIYSVPNLTQYSNLKKYNVNPLTDIEYAIKNFDIDLINSSSNEENYVYELSFSAQWYDAIVAMYNIPLIASAGNGINKFLYPIAPGNGYNSIGVGVYRFDINQMEDYVYTTSTTDQTRVTYKPDLVVAMDEYNNVYGATSAGAPVVSAIVAMMMELDSSLKGCPEIIKAILMASCQEKANPSTTDQAESYEEVMEDGLTPKQGAGKVNALRALNIVAFGTYGYVTMWSTDNYVYAPNINLNSEVYGNSSVDYPLNVSISWLRENTMLYDNSKYYRYDTSLGTKHELNLRVWYNGQNNNEIIESTTENSGKQLVFYGEPVTDKTYRVRIYRGANDVNNNESFPCGYAYSVGNFEKALERVEITGTTAIGETLTATAYTADGTLAETVPLSYYWYRSTDGQSWQMISNALNSTYTLTSADKDKFIMCEVVQDYLCGIERTCKSATYVVLYGDVDLDGEISVIDANTIHQYINNLITLTESQLIAADFDGDGVISVMDVTAIKLYLANNP